MSGSPLAPPPGWYPADGDPPGTQRYWDGDAWQGRPRPIPGVVASDTFPLAPTLLRVLARSIDLVVWIALFGIVLSVFRLARLDSFDAAAGYLTIAVYEIYLVGARGATLGKIAVGLELARVDNQPIGWSTAFRRAVFLVGTAIVSLIPLMGLVAFFALFLLAVVGSLMLYSEEAQQTPWDKFGRTMVVKSDG